MFTTGVSNNRTTSVKRTKCKTMFNIAGIEGQLDVVEPIMNSKSKVFGRVGFFSKFFENCFKPVIIAVGTQGEGTYQISAF